MKKILSSKTTYFLSVAILVPIIMLAASICSATVATSTSRIKHTCNSVLTSFAFTFNVNATDEVLVIESDSSDAETTLVETTDYSVSCTNSDCTSGGTVELVAACSTGEFLTIARTVDITQESDFTEGMLGLYETFESSLDKDTRIDQQVQEEVDRSLKVKISSTIPDVEVPISASRAIGWDSTATGLTTYSTTAAQAQASFDTIDNYSNDLDAAIAAIGASVSTLYIAGATASLSESATVPATLKIVVLEGGYIDHNGNLLVFTGPLEAGLYQIFTESTAGISFTAGSVDKVYPQWWPACLPDGSTDCYSAYNLAINGSPDYGIIWISPGLWNFDTQIIITDAKPVNFWGAGQAVSMLTFSLDTSTDCIIIGESDDVVNTVTNLDWRDFAIASDDGNCRAGLVLKGVVRSDFNIALPVYSHNDRPALWIQWALECNYNITSSSNIGYPYAGAAYGYTTDGYVVRVSSAAEGSTIFNACNLHVNIANNSDQWAVRMQATEGGSLNGRISGIIQGMENALYISGGINTNITDLHIEDPAGGLGDGPKVRIDDNHNGVIGPNVKVGDDAGHTNQSISINNCLNFAIDGVDVGRISIADTSEYTRLGKINYASVQSGRGLTDNSTSTVSETNDVGNHSRAGISGVYSDMSNTVINGSAERWTTTSTKPPGAWGNLGGAATFARETTIVKHGTASHKVTMTTANGVAVDLFSGGALAQYTSHDRGTVTAWIYVDDGTSSDITVTLDWDGGSAGSKEIATITTTDEWTRISAAYALWGPSRDATTQASLEFLPAANGTIIYLDAVSNIVGYHGAPVYWAGNPDEFPTFTGQAVDYNPADLADGTQESKDVTVSGAALGMVADCGSGADVLDCSVTADVTAANTVTILILNETGGNANIDQSTWNCVAIDYFP